MGAALALEYILTPHIVRDGARAAGKENKMSAELVTHSYLPNTLSPAGLSAFLARRID
jgi:hypothetical protein